MTDLSDRMRLRAQAQRKRQTQWTNTNTPTPKVEIPDYFIPPKTLKGRRTPSGDYAQLARRLGSDPEAGKRMIQSLLDTYPDKSETWCYQKALQDLERDRK